MPGITIKNIPDDLYQRLVETARAQHRSLAKEIIVALARRKLLYLHRARNLKDLKQPPGNRLEKLKGDREGQSSIRINDQWRICFKWIDGDAHDVEIVDYH